MDGSFFLVIPMTLRNNCAKFQLSNIFVRVKSLNNRTIAHVDAVGRHLQFSSQSCLKYSFNVGIPPGDIVNEPIIYFAMSARVNGASSTSRKFNK
jgi:hypothetical protein